MTHAFATQAAPDTVSPDFEIATLTFIDDVDYEFVGGGTAVNSD